ncbi:unnamed protein product [Didymodactylos carnosus]|uniref:Uncharacterized protein n=1 Tax=Didymodactylos carnosus TaxID=1234261 RepID=A0A815JG89_9BILA|nr:unnamed protein product [Didymodactylos carnosus]CAF1378978.1 unnamed protein product [Didymodactylos carnosus]CAF3577780.1 unnamed protein product [Didymodactylos carnosus]CAF4272105.1 unnamed protein product [Didymodactylos carnosus]
MAELYSKFRTFDMYGNKDEDSVSDEVKVFQCEQSDETSSINSELSAMTMRSFQYGNHDQNVGGDIKQRLNKLYQLAEARKRLQNSNLSDKKVAESQQNEELDPKEFGLGHHTRLQNVDNHDEEEYDEAKGEELLQGILDSVLKPKSKQKAQFMEHMKYKPEMSKNFDNNFIHDPKTTELGLLRWQQQQVKKTEKKK